VVGSPTRVCPHCNATLPFKSTAASPRPAAPPVGTAAAAPPRSSSKKPAPKVSASAAAAAAAALVDEVSMSAIPISTSVATFLGKYQERMASCKVNHLKRSVGDLCVAIKSVLEEGRGFEAAGIKAGFSRAEFTFKGAGLRV